jgi:hypothetical protein
LRVARSREPNPSNPVGLTALFFNRDKLANLDAAAPGQKHSNSKSKNAPSGDWFTLKSRACESLQQPV